MKKAGRAPRDSVVRLVTSQEEQEKLYRAADLAGTNFSGWARQLLLAEAQKILNQHDAGWDRQLVYNHTIESTRKVQAFAPGDAVLDNPFASLNRSGSEDQE